MRIINRSFFCFALLVFLCCADSRQIIFAQTGTLSEYVVVPSKTHFDIDRFRPKSKAEHLAYFNPAAAPKNNLLIHFVGTGGNPNSSKEWLRFAASQGFHVISIAYPNEDSIASLCTDSQDADCHEKARLEVIDGTDRTPLVFVRRSDSIEFRVIKLLQYLQRLAPAQNWAQYLDANNSPLWEHIITSGHSQGGGHAALIAKSKNVARVIQFASTGDYSSAFGSPAAWLSKPSVTPTSRYYGFGHQRDQQIPVSLLLANWAALGMNPFGVPLNVETTPAPYQNTHRLLTNLEPRVPGEFHGSVISDIYLPRNNGQIVFLPVWNYLLDFTPPAANTNFKNAQN